MEGKVAKLFEEKHSDIDILTDEFFKGSNSKQDGWDDKFPKQNARELAEEEETLRIYLDKLKRENFTLQTSIKAWQTTLEFKVDEFKEAQLKLDEAYNEIWSERENFCSKLDKFNNEYGILSDWWENQIKSVVELENHGEENSEDRKLREEIEKLEKCVAELKKEMEKNMAEREIHPTGVLIRHEVPRRQVKKVTFSEADEEIESPTTGREDYDNNLYSLVDLEKVRKAKQRRKNNFSGGEKSPRRTPN